MGVRVAVIDYGSGNIRSVSKALERLGAEVEVMGAGFDPQDFDKFVLPGVGAFGDTVQGLKERGLWDVVASILERGLPYLGICLGMQILCKASEESEGVEGFGLFPATVRRFRPSPECKVPQMGWNQVFWEGESPRLFSGIPNGSYFYFCHSYYVPIDEVGDGLLAWTEYGLRYASAVGRGRIMGVQFHPEKSQRLGLELLRNFLYKV